MNNNEFNFERRRQRAYERFGTDCPSCGRCGKTDWRCLETCPGPGAPLPKILCANCRKIGLLETVTGGLDALRRAALKRLGTLAPHCAHCGEDDWRCLEAHHIAGRRAHAAIVILCANCHKIMSLEQEAHPPQSDVADPALGHAGRFLIGLADLLRATVEPLTELGLGLIERSKDDPSVPRDE